MPVKDLTAFKAYKDLVLETEETKQRHIKIIRDQQIQIASLERALDTMNENFEMLLKHSKHGTPVS